MIFFSIVVVIVIVMTVMFTGIVFNIIIIKQQYEAGYLDACKDFYKGKLKYDLIENPDGTKEWKKVNFDK